MKKSAVAESLPVDPSLAETIAEAVAAALKRKAGPPKIRAADLPAYLGLRARSSVWRIMRRDPSFPKPEKRGGRWVTFDREAVDEWLARTASTA